MNRDCDWVVLEPQRKPCRWPPRAPCLALDCCAARAMTARAAVAALAVRALRR